MLKKFTFSMIIALAVFSVSNGYSRDAKPKSLIGTAIDGSEAAVLNDNVVKNTQPLPRDNQTVQTASFVVSFVPFGLSIYYDTQSNSSANTIWQDPVNPNNVHMVFNCWNTFNVAPRLIRYYYSDDRGLTWSYVGDVNPSQSGFPSIDGFKDNGIPVVTTHTTDGGAAAARSQVFVDLGVGFGSFQRLDPGLNGLGSQIWGRVLTTGNSTNPVKFALTTSQNPDESNSATNQGTTITPPGTFSPYNTYPADNAEQYCFALGQDGRIGNAFIYNGLNSDAGDVGFRESVDGGLTWSAATVIYNANPDADTTGALRGINMVYLGNTPCVTFEEDRILGTGYYPTLPSKIKFWSPSVNGGTPITVASDANIPFYPNLGPSASNGTMTAICRPVIGKTTNSASNTLFLAMEATTADIQAADSNAYYSIWLSVSYNGGAAWSAPEKITPATPLQDYRYVSLAKENGLNLAGDKWKLQMMSVAHTYAGAFAASQPPGPYDMVGITVDVPTTGITNVGSYVPSNYSLKQNFPNPFNPTTSIRFDIQKTTNVTLKVYNANGQEVQTLVNNELVNPGTKEVIFTGNDLSSGIYYYTLFAGDFKETKKMMLIK